MAGGLKSLAKETVIYGVSSIIGKFLNWLLTPMYTFILVQQSDLGVITNLYGWTALMIVMLTYGMETGLFRFANKNEENPQTVYTTTLISIASTSLLFLALILIFLEPITGIWQNNAIKPKYIAILAIILTLDAISSIPFAWLRFQKRPIRFASIKLLFVALNIGFNLFFLVLCPWLAEKNISAFSWFDIHKAVYYVLISNLLATFIQTLFLLPQLRVKYRFDNALLKRMLLYSLPLLVLGVAGILNQTIDKIVFPWLYPDKGQAYTQLGIYGANFKIAVIMVMFTQAFRYAFEPFIFAKNKEEGEGNKKSYADATKYFILFALFIFLAVVGYLDIVKKIIAPEYHEGLKVVPIVMMGELFFGVYFNLSLWYKLTDQTKWGAYMSLIGFVVIIAINIVFIPHFGYMACAWAAFFSNLVMMLLSYFLGQKNFPIRYDLKTIGFFVLISILIFGGIRLVHDSFGDLWMRLSINTLLIALYVWIILKKELSLRELPVVGKYFKS